MRARLLLLIGLLIPLSGQAVGLGPPLETPAVPRVPVGPPDFDTPPGGQPVAPPVGAPPLDLILPDPHGHLGLGIAVQAGPPEVFPALSRPASFRGNIPPRDEWLEAFIPFFRGEPSEGNHNGDSNHNGSEPPNGPPVPEPSTVAMLALGLLGLAARRPTL